jgi:hypothetical protein
MNEKKELPSALVLPPAAFSPPSHPTSLGATWSGESRTPESALLESFRNQGALWVFSDKPRGVASRSQSHHHSVVNSAAIIARHVALAQEETKREVIRYVVVGVCVLVGLGVIAEVPTARSSVIALLGVFSGAFFVKEAIERWRKKKESPRTHRPATDPAEESLRH